MAYLSSRLKNSEKQKINTRIRLLSIVLCVGVVGFLVVVLMMNSGIWASSSALAASQKYAQQGVMFIFLELLQIPALILFSVIIGYALNGLLDCYKTRNSPDFYRHNSSKVAGVQVGRKARRETQRAGGVVRVGRNRRTPLV